MDNKHSEDPRFCPQERVTALLARKAYIHAAFCPDLGEFVHGLNISTRFLEVTVKDTDSAATRAQKTLERLAKEDVNKSFITWTSSKFRPCIVYKASDKKTIICDIGNSTCHMASPAASLSIECPSGSVFLGQVVVDRQIIQAEDETQKEHWSLRILLFDIIQHGQRSFIDEHPANRRKALESIEVICSADV